jgi:hypothetical protein
MTPPNGEYALSPPRLMLALEPRILFDAAGLATAVDSDLTAGLPADFAPAEAPEQIPAFVPPAADLTNDTAPADEKNFVEANLTVPETNAAVREIVFVDAGVDDAQTLLSGIARDVEVVMLDATRDGIGQISEALKPYKNLDTIHIVSHGGPGYFSLGNSRVDTNTVESYSTDLTAWHDSLTQEADILIYGCDVAATESGEALLARLGELSGADVAGSSDATGSAALGGDWDLEKSTGSIQSLHFAAQSDLAAYSGLLQGGQAGGAPAISIADSALSYTENGAATQIDSAATLSDADGDSDWDGGTLAVEISANAEAADRLSMPDNVVGAINTDGSNICDGATVIGTLSAADGTVTNNTTLTITFNANATNGLVQQVVQAIHYDNTSNTPGTGDRTFNFSATDKNGDNANDARTIAVSAVNDAPLITSAILVPSEVRIVGNLSKDR